MQITQQNDLPVVIFAGGTGSRLGEILDSEKIPKPAVRIGGVPIIEHIMGIWKRAGFTRLIVAGGFRVDKLRYLESDMVTVVDTHIENGTVGRIQGVLEYINSENFGISYGDVLTGESIKNMYHQHIQSSATMTMLLTHPTPRFGEVEIDKNNVIRAFREKPQSSSLWVNGGYMIANKVLLDWLTNPMDMLEESVLPRLASTWGLMGYPSEEWWMPMDTPKEWEILDNMARKGNMPWTGKA